MIPISAFEWLINLQDELLMKSGLWSFNATNASLLAEVFQCDRLVKGQFGLFFVVCIGDFARYILARLFVSFCYVFLGKG